MLISAGKVVPFIFVLRSHIHTPRQESVCPNKTHKLRCLKSKLGHGQENKENNANKDIVGIWTLNIRMIIPWKESTCK